MALTRATWHGAGTLRSCDPDRMVLKKVVLSGYPVKVHKHKAAVRWMFYSPEDVRWFRPLELWTKHGRRGPPHGVLVKTCGCMRMRGAVLSRACCRGGEGL